MPASYKIPQNVDMEDKIFGPFTLKQFLYLLAAALVTFVSFNVFYAAAVGIFWLIVVFTWVVAAAFVFIRPYDQSFSKFIFSFIWFSTKPQRRTWKRLPSLGRLNVHEGPVRKAAPAAATPSADEVRSRLQRLAHVVDTRGWDAGADTAAPDLAERVTGGDPRPRYNLPIAASDEPEDILAREDGETGFDRASAELERALKTGVPKPAFKPSAASAPVAPAAAPVPAPPNQPVTAVR